MHDVDSNRGGELGPGEEEPHVATDVDQDRWLRQHPIDGCDRVVDVRLGEGRFRLDERQLHSRPVGQGQLGGDDPPGSGPVDGHSDLRVLEGDLAVDDADRSLVGRVLNRQAFPLDEHLVDGVGVDRPGQVDVDVAAEALHPRNEPGNKPELALRESGLESLVDVRLQLNLNGIQLEEGALDDECRVGLLQPLFIRLYPSTGLLGGGAADFDTGHRHIASDVVGGDGTIYPVHRDR